MFESIMKLVRKVTKKEDQTLKSKDAAKERLHLVLMQDRANVSADFLDLMKQEIIDVIKKYIEIDESAIDVKLTNKDNGDGTNGAPALYANIPILNIKDEVRQTAKVKTKDEEKKENFINDNEEKEDEGCCHHSVSKRRKRELIYHPLKHTFNIFIFILIITIILNFIIEIYSEHAILHVLLGKVKFLEPVITAIIGLIPNCAVSIALTMLLIKGSISFGAVMSGLLSNAGLGILVLFRHNENIKDALKIVGILLTISILSGLLIQLI